VTLDIIDCLKRYYKYNIKSKSSGGDTLENMVYGTETHRNFSRKTPQVIETLNVIAKIKPRAFLFSAGGNDLVGNDLMSFLNHKSSGLPVIREDYVEGTISKVMRKSFEDMAKMVWKVNSTLPFITHGYGHPIPDGRAVFNAPFGYKFVGPWILPYLMKKGIEDSSERITIITQFMDRFNDMLADLASQYELFFHIDLRSTIKRSDWINELHLSSEAYGAVVFKFDEQIKSVPLPSW